MANGNDILDVAMPHVHEQYILGASVPIGNPNWHGPWDCAEFVSWCAYQAYGKLFAVRPPKSDRGESYSGWWYEDAINLDATIPVEKALATPGAILVRKPGAFNIRIGHVAISCGNGSTVEAHSSAVGVAVREGAAARQWSIGVVLPGVDYGAVGAVSNYRTPSGLLFVQKPFIRSGKVQAVQEALVRAGIDPGDMDSVYGPATEAAVAAFQARHGLLVDGVVGRETAGALGLAWPITL